MLNKKNLYIIGADGLARELESWLNQIPLKERAWEFKGFLYNLRDKNPLKDYPTDFKILGDWDSFEFNDDDCCLIGVADVNWREKIYNHLKGKVEIASFVGHSAVIGKFTDIPDGTIISPNCVVSTNVSLGHACYLNIGTQIGHDVVIGDFCSIMPNVNIGGFCKIGDKVFIGSGATIIPKRKIASNASIGAGSVVIRNIKKEGISVFGNPAQQI